MNKPTIRTQIAECEVVAYYKIQHTNPVLAEVDMEFTTVQTTICSTGTSQGDDKARNSSNEPQSE